MLPGAFDPESAEIAGFAVIEVVLDDAIDTAATRPTTEAGAEFGQVLLGAAGDNLNIAIISVADPAAQIEFAGFSLYEPAVADPLHTTLNEEMENHK